MLSHVYTGSGSCHSFREELDRVKAYVYVERVLLAAVSKEVDYPFVI